MARIGRARTTYLAFLLCAILTASSATVGVSVAEAGPLEEVTSTVGKPVQEITETVTAPVGEATEAAAAAAREATGKEGSAARQIVAPVADGVTETVAKAPVKRTDRSAHPTGSPPTGSVERTVTEATHTLGEVVDSVVPAIDSARSAAAVPAEGVAGAAGPVAPPTSQAPDEEVPATGEDTFEAPSTNGSVQAPRGRWVAYVWPAVALTRSRFADLLRGASRTGLLASPERIVGGGQVHVAAASASSGDSARGTFSPAGPPLFSRLPGLLGVNYFPTAVPLPALVALLVMALLVAILAATIAWDMGILQAWRPWDRPRRRRRHRVTRSWTHGR